MQIQITRSKLSHRIAIGEEWFVVFSVEPYTDWMNADQLLELLNKYTNEDTNTVRKQPICKK